MRITHCLVGTLLFIVLLPCLSTAQFRTGNLKVRVTFADGYPCNIRVLVQLMDSASTSPVAEGYTNDSGMIEFNNVAVGHYHVVVSGQGIEATASGLFEVDARRTSQFEYVSVKRIDNARETTSGNSGTGIVAVAALKIPEQAAREFDKATALMQKQNWKEAREHLNAALHLYPKYVAAYNNLGVIYAHLGDREQEREALEKAVSLNDHFAPALVNLARLAIAEHDLTKAETLLTQASSADPKDAMTLVLLANVQLLELQYDSAISSSKKAHLLGDQPHALAHYVAARGFEHQGRPLDAISEFEAFLIEEPTGERAQAVRKELATLQAQ